MAASEHRRLSVAAMDVSAGQETEFLSLAMQFEALMLRKQYGRAELVRDEASPRRFYAVRYWTDTAAAASCHADPDAQALIAMIDTIASVTQLVNGTRPQGPSTWLFDERRARLGADRRSGFDRHGKSNGPEAGERRSGPDRRLAALRLLERSGAVDLVGVARRARESADAAFSHFKVGAALESADGTVITGCNIENATYGLTMCAERVALFKAISEGHRVFTRIAIVADTDAPTPPCGACRQVLWEFGGNLEIQLANLTEKRGTHRLADLLPLPFDRRLL